MDGLNPITRKEIYLAKASGDQVETPEPITREEMYLKKIAEGGGGSSLPDTPAEDGTYALQNTVAGGEGTLSWASGGSGGGVMVVNVSDGSFNKKYSEILASTTPVVIHQASEGASYWGFVTAVFDDDGEYTVVVTDSSERAVSYYIADSADGYPELE